MKTSRCRDLGRRVRREVRRVDAGRHRADARARSQLGQHRAVRLGHRHRQRRARAGPRLVPAHLPPLDLEERPPQRPALDLARAASRSGARHCARRGHVGTRPPSGHVRRRGQEVRDADVDLAPASIRRATVRGGGRARAPCQRSTGKRGEPTIAPAPGRRPRSPAWAGDAAPRPRARNRAAPRSLAGSLARAVRRERR